MKVEIQGVEPGCENLLLAWKESKILATCNHSFGNIYRTLHHSSKMN